MFKSDRKLFEDAKAAVFERALELVSYTGKFRQALGETSEIIEPLDRLEDAVTEMEFRQEMLCR